MKAGGKHGNLARVAIVGAATLKGKELKEVLDESSFPAYDIRLLDDDEALGTLDAVGEEVTFIQSVGAEQFDGVDVAFFASGADFTAKHWKLAEQAGSRVLDLSYALEAEPGAAVRAPWLERELGTGPEPGAAPALTVVAHPAAAVLGLLLARAARLATLRSAVVTMFEPASEHGKRGMDELHQQTVNLLSFQRLPRDIFDSQVAFNMLARYGAASSPTLESVERRILAHFRSITGGRVPVPSLMLLQPPVFHGHAFSVYIELEGKAAVGDVAQALAGEHVTVSRAGDESPSNVSAAGQEHILVSVRRDAHNERGLWLWAAADNLRVAALLAVECAHSMISGIGLPPADKADPPSKERLQ